MAQPSLPLREAVVFVGAVEVHCPECHQPIREPNTHSIFWTADEIEATYDKTETYDAPMCHRCGTFIYVRLPRKVEFNR